MKRYFVEIAYNGSDYHGWQIQPNATSVQQTVNEAVFKILQDDSINVVGCGRTDTGVHASQYFLHFDTEKEVKDDFAFRLNAVLPDDIVSKRHFEVKNDQHARFDASSRTYQYKVLQSANPFQRHFTYLIRHELDFEKMNEAAKLLIGQQDFTSFSKVHTDTLNNNCDVYHAQWTNREGLWTFEISANRFLRNMVRAVVGTLLEVGAGKMSNEDLKKVIEAKDRSEAGRSVPGHALFLTNIKYPFVDE